MPVITGTLQNVDVRQVQTKFGMKKAYDFHIDGQKYGSFKEFDVDLGFVELEYTENGRYKNVVSIKNISGSQVQAQQQQQPQKNTQQAQSRGSSSYDDKQILIVRQSSVKASIDILNKNMDKYMPIDVIQLSEMITEYVMNGYDPDVFESGSGVLEEDEKEAKPVNKSKASRKKVAAPKPKEPVEVDEDVEEEEEDDIPF